MTLENAKRSFEWIGGKEWDVEEEVKRTRGMFESQFR
jgi:hypothetical protein